MAIVKDKTKLLTTSLSDFSIEMVNGIPFYERYAEMGNIFKKYVSSVDFSQCFAQPNVNSATKELEWYCFKVSDDAVIDRLSDLEKTNPQAYEDAQKQVDKVVQAIKSGINNATENDRLYLNAALKGIEGEDAKITTYLCDGKILFGIWGMKKIPGRDLEVLIREDASDHRVFSINYTIQEGGKLSFSSINRKYGYTLGPNDVPTVEAPKGWKFTKWSPQIPHGTKVTDNLVFTAVCERDSVGTDGVNGVDNSDETIVDSNDGGSDNNGNPDNPKEHTVRFKSESGGTLDGKTELTKRDGDKILSNEIPNPVPKEGYRFIGWDRNPVNHTVTEDTEFVARYEEVPEKKSWWAGFWGWGAGCLNWLLLLLLLALLGLLLWYLLGRHNLFFCGCNCNDTYDTVWIEPEPEIDTTDDIVPEEEITPAEEYPCNSEQHSGGEQGYLGEFDMGQQSGTFPFEYDTYTQHDRITIYDGKGTRGNVIYRYEGGSEGMVLKRLRFSQRWVTVKVEGLESGTSWEFNVGCPNN